MSRLGTGPAAEPAGPHDTGADSGAHTATGERPPIGVIGAGCMGLAIVQRLRATGHAVRVRDIDPAREALAAAEGAVVDPSAAALARHCPVVLVVVVDGAQVHEVLFGAAGVVQGLAQGAAQDVVQGVAQGMAQPVPPPRTVLLCPTIAPADTEAAAAGLAAAGIAAIDAPMSGGPARARDGTMSLMLAGDPALLARHETLLATLAAQRVVVGSRIGDGARTKLVNNLLATINLAGAAEALALARHLGLDPATTLDVIERSSGQSWIGSERLRRALAGDLAPRAATALLAKDSALALAMAQQAGLALHIGPVAAGAFAAACRAGLATADDASLLDWMSGQQGPGSPDAANR